MDSLVQLIKSAKYLVVFTGAGMSTESGLPDFRSANRGLWTAKQKQYLSSINALNDHLQEFIGFYRKRVQGIHDFKPHKGHYLLAEWERKGQLKQIITQNVDGFHQEAGNQKVAELHGTLKKVHCETCGKSYLSEEYLHENYSCIVLFGEMLPEKPFIVAEEAAINADVFLVLGSSLSVSPANQFPLLAIETGAKLIIVNKEPTEMDRVADIVIHESIGSVLGEINLNL